MQKGMKFVRELVCEGVPLGRGGNEEFHAFVLFNLTKSRYEYFVVVIKDEENWWSEPYTLDDINTGKVTDQILISNRLNKLREILEDHKNKGYEVYKGLEGYWQYIKIRRAKDRVNWYAMAHLDSTKQRKFVAPADPDFHIQPFQDFGLLKRQYEEHLVERIKARENSQQDDTPVNELEIELGLIEYLIAELTQKSKGEYSPDGDIEEDNCSKFLGWLTNKKGEILDSKSATEKSKPLRKIKWNGTQKNLAELFLELELKGWIDKIEVGERAKVCESIVSIFDLTATQKKAGTNILKSFTEIMTPFYDNMTKATSYPKVFTERYKKAFENIKNAKKTT